MLLDDLYDLDWSLKLAGQFLVAGILAWQGVQIVSLPIGGVMATEGVVVPAWVGYDIGCGVCTVAVNFSPDSVVKHADVIIEQLYALDCI